MQKNVKKGKTKKFIIITLSIILFVILALIYLYISINLYIYKCILDQKENENVEINIPINHIFLSNKNISLINSLNKNIDFNFKNYSYAIHSSNVVKNGITADIKIIQKQSSIEHFKNLNVIEIEIGNENVDNFRINNTNYLHSDLFDVYFFDTSNNTFNLYISKHSKAQTIPLKKLDNTSFCKKYLLVYVPLKDITLENIEINKTLSKNLNIVFEPENATNKELNFNYEQIDAFEIDSYYNLKAILPGNYNLTISSANNAISKNINIKINDIVTNIIPNKNAISLKIDESFKLECQVEPENAANKILTFSSSNEQVATISSDGTIIAKSYGKCEIEVKTQSEPIYSIKIPLNVNYKIASSSIAVDEKDITYIQGILIVNKNYGLPRSFNPGVNTEAYEAYKNMANDASNEGISLPILSSYRSYDTQAATYNNYCQMYGYEYANRISAKPGQSEHQTGLAFDIGSFYISYENTKEGKWLANNCHKYGFIIRYPKGKEHITGYIYEPWHIRYLGIDLATKVKNSGLCLEEYLNIV